MRYQRHFRMTIEGVQCDADFEFTYQVRRFGGSRIPIVTDTHKILADGVRESAPYFWLLLPVQLHDQLDQEMVYWHDAAVGSHQIVERAI